MARIRVMTTPKATVLCILLTLALALLVSSLPFSALYLIIFTLFLAPPAMLVISAAGGWLAAMACLTIIAAVHGNSFGGPGIVIVLAYLLPAAAAFLWCLDTDMAFVKSATLLLIVYAASVTAVYLALQSFAGGELFNLAANTLEETLDNLPQKDTILYTLWKSGFLSLSGFAEGTPVFDESTAVLTFLPNVRDEFYAQLRTRVSIWMRALVPTLLSSYSLQLSSLGLGLAVHIANKVVQKEAGILKMPPFAVWHIPKTASRYLWPLVIGYVMGRMASDTMAYTGQMMYAVFNTVYVIQGSAALYWWFRSRSVGAAIGKVLVLMVLLILPPVLFWMGLADQLLDFRHLRHMPDQQI